MMANENTDVDILDGKFEDIEKPQETNEDKKEDRQVTEPAEAGTNNSSDKLEEKEEEEISFDILNEKVLEELEGYKTKAQELETQNKALLKQLERMIMKEGAVISRDENEKKDKAEEYNTSASRYNQTEITTESLRGQLF